MQKEAVHTSLVLFIAQGAYAGRVPAAPGTAGTAIGVLLYLFLKDLALPWYGAVCAMVIVAGTWAAGRAEVILGSKDHQSIVIDEIAGFLVSMFLVPTLWGYIAAGFALFRFFDIVKPWPIRRFQDLTGGTGVMADDLAAGIFANLVLQLVSIIAGRT
jgi:phosphatidylglycerophosphatase A